jgi:hypothetical protein
MFRALALMVVLTHLGVVSAPCCDARFEPDRFSILARSDAQVAHHPPAPPVEEETRPAEPAHDHHVHDGRDASHATTQARANVEAPGEAQLTRTEIRAVCLCGCSTNTNSPGTTTSPRLGFALFPPAPPRLVEAEPSTGVQLEIPLPAAVPDTLDHVPILFS